MAQIRTQIYTVLSDFNLIKAHSEASNQANEEIHVFFLPPHSKPLALSMGKEIIVGHSCQTAKTSEKNRKEPF